MLTLKATSWLLYSLGVIATAHPDSDNTGFKRLTLPNNNPGIKLLSRQASDTCSGSCETCFGAGFELCDSSSTICYLPGDALYGEESCSATGTIDTSSDSSFPTTDTCENGGLSCAYCFGEGQISCPGAADYCYDPNNSTTSCPGDTGTDSESTASDSDSASTATGSADSDASTASTSEASGSDTADGVVGGSDDTDTSSSGTSTGSSSGTSGSNSNGDGNGNSNQGSSSNNNDANGDPIEKSSGYSVVREGLASVLVAGSVALVAAWHLLI